MNEGVGASGRIAGEKMSGWRLPERHRFRDSACMEHSSYSRDSKQYTKVRSTHLPHTTPKCSPSSHLHRHRWLHLQIHFAAHIPTRRSSSTFQLYHPLVPELPPQLRPPSLSSPTVLGPGLQAESLKFRRLIGIDKSSSLTSPESDEIE